MLSSIWRLALQTQQQQGQTQNSLELQRFEQMTMRMSTLMFSPRERLGVTMSEAQNTRQFRQELRREKPARTLQHGVHVCVPKLHLHQNQALDCEHDPAHRAPMKQPERLTVEL